MEAPSKYKVRKMAEVYRRAAVTAAFECNDKKAEQLLVVREHLLWAIGEGNPDFRARFELFLQEAEDIIQGQPKRNFN